MTDAILLVDDDSNLLDACRRQLRKQFSVETALGGAEGLEKLREKTFAVVVSDMRMPGMDGVQFLSQVRALSPDTIRLMLTGNADQQTAIDAVNQGHIFRFLNKPCPPETLAETLTLALDQYRLAHVERELLEKTLGGSLRVLIEILTLVAPDAFGRAQGIRQNMKTVAKAMGVGDTWQWEFAAMLAPLGLVTIPTTTVRNAQAGNNLLDAERDMLRRVPQISHDLLAKIPRLEPVAEIILYQNKNYDGTGFPETERSGGDIPLGARVLKVLTDLAEREASKISRAGAFALLRRQASHYDPQALDTAQAVLCVEKAAEPEKPSVAVPMSALRAGQTTGRDIVSVDGKLLVSAGRLVTPTLLEQLRNFAVLTEVQEPIYIARDSVVRA